MEEEVVITPKEVEEEAAAAKTTETATSRQHEPLFPPATAMDTEEGNQQYRKISIPAHRLGALKNKWVEIFTPLVAQLKLQVRMNLKEKAVEIQTSASTVDSGAIQRGSDFVKAFVLGFEIKDAVALLRLDDLYIDTFEVEDVKRLHGDHLSRAIGRLAGRDGRTKILIENSTRTRIVLADHRIHILGSFANIKVAKDAICDLILGSPPGKVQANLRAKAARLSEHW